MNVYDSLPNPRIVFAVNEHFYELVYAHPWLSKFFAAVEQDFITSQQTDFIIGAIGGPKRFNGRGPAEAHPHMMITDELYDLRRALLEASFDAVRAPEQLRVAWLRIDEAFRGAIVKRELAECRGRWRTDAVLDFPPDDGVRRAS
ncbi:MAG: group 1 truncated hemoglobin [Planctomycetota bacterium]